MHRLIRLSRCRRGATAIEYGLIAALLAIMLIAGMTNAGEGVLFIFEIIGDTIRGV